MTDPRRYYWDACVFLTYINGVPDRVPIIDDFMSRSRRGEIEIVTSVLSQVGVAFAVQEKTAGLLDQTVEEKIDRMWADRKAIKLAEFHPLLYREARGLIRFAMQNGWSLKPPDAIHLATAKRLQVSEIHTYERSAWNKYEPQLGIKICEPEPRQGVFSLSIVAPTVPPTTGGGSG